MWIPSLLGQVAAPLDHAAEFTATKSQFEKQSAQLEGAKVTAAKAVAARYLTALEASEKSATASSKLNAVTAILAEKQAKWRFFQIRSGQSADGLGIEGQRQRSHRERAKFCEAERPGLQTGVSCS